MAQRMLMITTCGSDSVAAEFPLISERGEKEARKAAVVKHNRFLPFSHRTLSWPISMLDTHTLRHRETHTRVHLEPKEGVDLSIGGLTHPK